MLNFDTFLSQAWTDHATDSAAVATRLPEGIAMMEKPEQVSALARLLVHVMGEHLGEWDRGLELLQSLRASAHFSALPDNEKVLLRSEAALLLGQGKTPPPGLSKSDRAGALATAAAALSALGQGDRAEKLYREALELARHFDKTDPAQRAIAVASNNLAAALEEKKDRGFRETELMLIAAHASRKHWELAGTWLEVERAEYRLTTCFLSAGKPGDAKRHAELCLEVCEANQAPAFELFLAHEALALVAKAQEKEADLREHLARAFQHFEAIPADERKWGEASLKKLQALAP